MDDQKELRCSFCGAASNEVEKLIKGVSLINGINAYICNVCISDGFDLIQEHKSLKKSSVGRKSLKSDYPTPKEIVVHLEQFVIGQQRAKKILAVGVYNHYKRIGKSTKTELSKANIMIVGPTGSGKTHIVENIAKFLKVPFATVDATSLTEAGYVGDDVDSILVRLLQSADGDVKKAERGIVYIDEIDKIAVRESRGRDIGGEGVQQSLLKMLEGSAVTISTTGKKNGHGPQEQIETKNILFICGGAFSGMTDKSNHAKKTLGLSAGSAEQKKEEAEEKVKAKDLVKYGMIPEFVGRFPVLAELKALAIEDMVKILTEPKNSIVKQYQELLMLDGVKLEFTQEFLEEVAKKATAEGTGARGLRAIMEPVLTDIMFDAPDDPKEIIITIEHLEEKK